MSTITDYSSLKSQIADHLNRTDLTSVIPTFIQLAEAKLLRDPRVRKFQNAGTFSITGDDISLPSDFMQIEDWYLDGSTYYGSIEIVDGETLGTLKSQHGSTGVPQWATIFPDRTVRFAPAPDSTYDSKLTYWRTIQTLSDTNTTNWLLDDGHADIYLYGALVESAPYLKDDNRFQLWQAMREQALNELDRMTWDRQWGGGMVRTQFRPIG